MCQAGHLGCTETQLTPAIGRCSWGHSQWEQHWRYPGKHTKKQELSLTPGQAWPHLTHSTGTKGPGTEAGHCPQGQKNKNTKVWPPACYKDCSKGQARTQLPPPRGRSLANQDPGSLLPRTQHRGAAFPELLPRSQTARCHPNLRTPKRNDK